MQKNVPLAERATSSSSVIGSPASGAWIVIWLPAGWVPPPAKPG